MSQLNRSTAVLIANSAQNKTSTMYPTPPLLDVGGGSPESIGKLLYDASLFDNNVSVLYFNSALFRSNPKLAMWELKISLPRRYTALYMCN